MEVVLIPMMSVYFGTVWQGRMQYHLATISNHALLSLSSLHFSRFPILSDQK